MTTTFDAATALTRLDAGRYHLDLAPEYAIMGTKPNGGYMLACLGRAALDTAQETGSAHEHVVSSSAQFLASPDVGPAEIDVTIDRIGKTASQVTAVLRGEGSPTAGVKAQFILGTLHEGSTPFWGEIEPVDITPLDECAPSMAPNERGNSMRFDPATSFTMGPDGPIVGGGGEFRAWIHDETTNSFDTVGLLYVADVLPPATFGVVMTGWVPTLSITVYNRAVPAPGPLRLHFRVQVIHDGYADEVCEAWDSTGRLVMQSTQLTALRLPPPEG